MSIRTVPIHNVPHHTARISGRSLLTVLQYVEKGSRVSRLAVICVEANHNTTRLVGSDGYMLGIAQETHKNDLDGLVQPLSFRIPRDAVDRLKIETYHYDWPLEIAIEKQGTAKGIDGGSLRRISLALGDGTVSTCVEDETQAYNYYQAVLTHPYPEQPIPIRHFNPIMTARVQKSAAIWSGKRSATPQLVPGPGDREGARIELPSYEDDPQHKRCFTGTIMPIERGSWAFSNVACTWAKKPLDLQPAVEVDTSEGTETEPEAQAA